MKKQLLSLIVIMISGFGYAFADYPADCPQGEERPDPFFLSTEFTGKEIIARPWRAAGKVWVKLEYSSHALIPIEKKLIIAWQDGVEYPDVCLGIEYFGAEDPPCGSFRLGSATYLAGKENLISSVENNVADPDSDAFDIFRGFRVYYRYKIEEDGGIPEYKPIERYDYFEIGDSNAYELVVSTLPEGTGTVAGSGLHEVGETFEVTAIPADGYLFSHWGEDTTQTENPIVTTMTDSDMTLTANFKVDPAQSSGGSGGSGSGGCFVKSLK